MCLQYKNLRIEDVKFFYRKCDIICKNKQIFMNFAIIMGGEETGVSKNNLKKSDFIVKIPMLRNFNSLNVSNAACAIIFEAVRQQLKHSV